MKNFIATLLISRGVPMLLGGDEFCRTQRGNSNAWGQDNEISWYDWRQLATNAEMERFVRLMIAFRRRHAVLRRGTFYAPSDILWFAPDGRPPSWSGGDGALRCVVAPQRPEGDGQQPSLCILFNASAQKIAFVLPIASVATPWRVFADTGRESPHDIRDGDDGPSLAADAPSVVSPNSMVILVGTP